MSILFPASLYAPDLHLSLPLSVIIISYQLDRIHNRKELRIKDDVLDDGHPKQLANMVASIPDRTSGSMSDLAQPQ
jgi:hypothetical protein